jgi:hypothetical protein
LKPLEEIVGAGSAHYYQVEKGILKQDAKAAKQNKRQITDSSNNRARPRRLTVLTYSITSIKAGGNI